MDSQAKLIVKLNNLLENDMISPSGGESDTDLLEPDSDGNSQEDMRITTPFSILDEILASPPIHNSNYTTTSTTSSTIACPLYCMTTTTAHSTISTTNPTFTLQHQPTTTTKPTSTTPPPPHTSYNTSPSPIHPHPPSTTTTKSKLTPSNTQFEHLPFTFHFIPSHPNYISKLKLPTHIAKLCSDIQHNAELSIIKIIGVHLFKQNKPKKSKRSKNNKKPITSNQGFNP